MKRILVALLSFLGRREAVRVPGVPKAKWETLPDACANSKAKRLLGNPLVGRTADSEEGLPFKPIRVNGSPIDSDNHPAVQIKSPAHSEQRTQVTWLTPTGEKLLEFAAHDLVTEGSAKPGEFLLVKIAH